LVTNNDPEVCRGGMSPYKMPAWMDKRMSSCAVVGNAAAILQDAKGRDVDAHQIVVRFNSVSMKNLHRHQDNVGTKMSDQVFYRSDHTVTGGEQDCTYLNIDHRPTSDGVSFSDGPPAFGNPIPYRSAFPQEAETSWWQSKRPPRQCVRRSIVNPVWMYTLSRLLRETGVEVSRSSVYPSSGLLIAVAMAIHGKCDGISVYGVGSNYHEHEVHEWEGQGGTHLLGEGAEGGEHFRALQETHSYPAEKEIWKALHNAGFVNLEVSWITKQEIVWGGVSESEAEASLQFPESEEGVMRLPLRM